MTPKEALNQLTARFETMRTSNATLKDGSPRVWTLAVTPVLPSEWPPKPGMVWVRYAYAHGQELQLADGVRVAKPWAVMVLHGGGATATLEQTSGVLEGLAIQGVRPLGPSEQRVAATADAAERIAPTLTTLSALPSSSAKPLNDMKAYYRLWLGTSGVIAEHLRAQHLAFFAWVASS